MKMRSICNRDKLSKGATVSCIIRFVYVRELQHFQFQLSITPTVLCVFWFEYEKDLSRD